MNILFKSILIVIFALASAMPLSHSIALAATGGPDGGGYTFIDSTEAGGPAYAFEDIAAPANSLNMTGDDKAVTASMGFEFKYYGTFYNSVYVSSNGHLDFAEGYGNANYNLNNLGIPQASSLVDISDNGWGVNPLIAVFFDDLDPLAEGAVYAATLGIAPNRRFVVQWDGVPHFQCLPTLGDPSNLLTFQAILYEGGNEILFQYNDVTTSDATDLCIAITNGASATVGLDFDSNVGLEYSVNAATIVNGLAIAFSPGPEPAISPSSTSLDFGDVLMATNSTALLKISNPGGSVLVIEDTTPALTAPFEIVSDDCTGSNLLAGDFCAISVTFAPLAEAAYSDSLIINSSDPLTPQTVIPLIGNGVISLPTGDIWVTDTTLPDDDLQADFGSLPVFTGAGLVFSVHNDGGGALSINAVEPPAAPFTISLDSCTGATLAPLDTCQVGVHFVALEAGVYHSTFNIISDDPDESPLTLHVSATAFPLAGSITVSDSAAPLDDRVLAFADTITGSMAVGTVTVGNGGPGDLFVNSISAPGAPFQIAQDSCTGVNLLDGELCTISLTFVPLAEAAYTDSLVIDSTDTVSPLLSVSLVGNGLAAGDIGVTDATPPDYDLYLDFGSLPVNTGADLAFSVHNDGGGALFINVVESPLPPFTISLDACTGATLAPQDTCQVGVHFVASVAGDFTSTFNIISDDPDESPLPLYVNASAHDLVLGSITVSDSFVPADDRILSFVDTPLGGTAVGTVTLGNNGPGNLDITSISSLLAPFQIDIDNCTGLSLLAGEFCTIGVSFAPLAEALYSDSLVVSSTDAVTPQLPVSIIGNGVGVLVQDGDIRLTDSTPPDYDLYADFGSLPVYTGADLVFDVHNDGAGALYISSVEPPLAPFSISSDGCTLATLAPLDTCQVIVHFISSVSGIYNSTFDILSDDPDESTLSLYVNASAYALAVGNITVSDSAAPGDDRMLVFVNTPLGSTAVGTVTVGNDGEGNLDISSLTVSADPPYSELLSGTCDDGSPLTPGTTLAPGGSCTIDLGFSPVTEADCLDGVLYISTNDPDESPLTVALSCVNNFNPPSAPGLAYPMAGAAGLPSSFEFQWNRSTDPDPGDTVTYRLYYAEKSVYDVSGFKNTTPIGPIAKARQAGAYAAAAMGVPGAFVMAVFMLSGGISRRRKAVLLMLIVLAAVMALAACGPGLGADYQSTGDVKYSVGGLKPGTIYYWKVTAVDSYGLSTDSATWSFSTTP